MGVIPGEHEHINKTAKKKPPPSQPLHPFDRILSGVRDDFFSTVPKADVVEDRRRDLENVAKVTTIIKTGK